MNSITIVEKSRKDFLTEDKIMTEIPDFVEKEVTEENEGFGEI